MSEINLTNPHHKLAVSVDESSQITIRHRRLHDELIVSLQELDELVQRAPEIRAAAATAYRRATGGVL